MVLLHGNLSIEVEGARGLWNERGMTEKLKQVGEIDPYFICKVGDIKRVIKSQTIQNSENPTWDVVRELFVCDDVEHVMFEVLSVASTAVTSDLSLGFYFVKAADLVNEKEIKGWFKLSDEKGKIKKDKGEIMIHIRYEDLEEIGYAPEVPWCYFKPMVGNRVTLYQDAHHEPGSLPVITKANGMNYVHGSCWKDIYAAVMAAEKLVYACGWAIFCDIKLVREHVDDLDSILTVGEMFKKKAEDGCTVLLMPWDEMLSTKNRDGLMGTHDEDTRKFFADTKVLCRPVMRTDDGTSGNWGGIAVGGMWTHHQKCVICDEVDPHDPTRRRLVCFLGGLDITDGRYDTPNHPLFRTLGTVHAPPDFYQNNFVTTNEYGPREPWHDIHMRVEGSAAYSVLQNFEDRWRKQVEEEADKLYPVAPDGFFTAEEETARWSPDPDQFVCQLFRSIDDRSAVFDADVPGLFAKKGRQVEASIHRAYCHQIRRANHFIYIENQYFLGSSHAWHKHADDFATNIIPLEIARKIINKIKANERFAAYIAIPLHPEGLPASGAVQEILYWQFRTVDAMYRMIHDALKEVGSDAKPTDYLNFFFFGNREIPDGGLPLTDEPPKHGSDADILSKSRRMMIYIHSKMMIVDDEYIIVGSANINDRSMAGTRDTEIALGSYQPYYTVEYNRGKLPKGNVGSFRKALWAEHLGQLSPVHDQPQSLECVHDVLAIAEKNFELYMQDKPVEMVGHLMPYPYKIEKDGGIKASLSHFPDTKASIKGRDHMFIPDTLTS
mmetsp:Transcript_8563/g.15489  ORF Transcript_8563/g.15489 Transcript_8563/m.15489 type:complete len:777 (-) Transcript_8563:193-2523(-)|eukprot:CAMPEP_0182443356 /NCGR_PEP_ID=MMETSP1172-20130603/2118_1 /TAXON_ID=708627 /ORGANISM="Timspurckia oligopyrenoides, Strain CCMP3278" /LENGTH=776 /DNA_ID=CAMNT_0024638615 /DNA_START=73 /DNA_END=2403 /DNA_ORIENTATION=-